MLRISMAVFHREASRTSHGRWSVAIQHCSFRRPLLPSDQQHTFVIRVRNSKAEWVTVQTGQTVNGELKCSETLQAEIKL